MHPAYYPQNIIQTYCAVSTVHPPALFLPSLSVIPSIFLPFPPTPTELGEAHLVWRGEDSPSDTSARQLALAF